MKTKVIRICLVLLAVILLSASAIFVYQIVQRNREEEKRIAEIAEGDYTQAKKGDIIEFGTYNDKAIKWQILEANGSEIVVITKDCIFVKAYNEEYKNVTWETCTLRTWLNDNFYNDAFSDEEKSHIAEVTNSNSDNIKFGTDGGKNTTDKVYLLSLDEAETYFSSDDDRIADYNGESMWWWLRSPGPYQHNAAIVARNGALDTYGDVSCDISVRPAMKILP